MSPLKWATTLALVLFLAMVVAQEIGFRIGRRDSARMADAHEGIGVIEAAIFALLGLLLGFSFGGATSRLDTRRDLIVDETNAISEAYLWLDILPDADQPAIRRLFRDYIDARLRVYHVAANLDSADRYIAVATGLQAQIWTTAVSAGERDSTHNATRLLLPAVSRMIDVTTARTVALRTQLPSLIFWLLVGVAISSALIAGYAGSKRRRRSTMHVILYSLAVTLTVYAVLDLDDPRFGLIRLESAEQVLQQLRDSIQG